MEFPAANEDHKLKSEVRIGLGKSQNRAKVEMKKDLDPQSRVLDKFGEFLSLGGWDRSMCPMGLYRREVFIKFH